MRVRSCACQGKGVVGVVLEVNVSEKVLLKDGVAVCVSVTLRDKEGVGLRVVEGVKVLLRDRLCESDALLEREKVSDRVLVLLLEYDIDRVAVLVVVIVGVGE